MGVCVHGGQLHALTEVSKCSSFLHLLEMHRGLVFPRILTKVAHTKDENEWEKKISPRLLCSRDASALSICDLFSNPLLCDFRLEYCFCLSFWSSLCPRPSLPCSETVVVGSVACNITSPPWENRWKTSHPQSESEIDTFCNHFLSSSFFFFCFNYFLLLLLYY